jgi:hypothetical protein
MSCEGGEELNHEEGISSGLCVNGSHQIRRVFSVTVECLGDEQSNLFDGEWLKNDFGRNRAGLARELKGLHQWMGGADLVVTVCADHKKKKSVLLDNQILYKA